MFHHGYASKGTFLLNKKLPPRTVQVRRSMIKVSSDRSLSSSSTFNALEVVTTRYIAQHSGRVETIFDNKGSALKAGLNYGDMDEHNAAEMILVGIPRDEPHLKDHLSTLLHTEKNNLKAGKLPVSESYYLMGTVDPTGELKEDEVCVILESGQISGDVLVYRNPGLHFGDIHVFKATYVKSLEEYVSDYNWFLKLVVKA